jgi:hypothetical protein
MKMAELLASRLKQLDACGDCMTPVSLEGFGGLKKVANSRTDAFLCQGGGLGGGGRGSGHGVP